MRDSEADSADRGKGLGKISRRSFFTASCALLPGGLVACEKSKSSRGSGTGSSSCGSSGNPIARLTGVRSEPFDLGTGWVYLPSSLKQARRVAKTRGIHVPERMLSAWRGFPDSMDKLAARAQHAPLATWLKSLRGARCALRLYDTAEVGAFGKAALLELRRGKFSQLLDFRSREAPSKQFPAAPAHPDPSWPPPAPLLQVYQLVGGIQYQLGGSGSLIPPDAVQPLARVASAFLKKSLAGHRLARRLADYVPFFESSGDFLCYHRKTHHTTWFGIESVSGVKPYLPIGQALAALYTSLQKSVYFHG